MNNEEGHKQPAAFAGKMMLFAFCDWQLHQNDKVLR